MMPDITTIMIYQIEMIKFQDYFILVLSKIFRPV